MSYTQKPLLQIIPRPPQRRPPTKNPPNGEVHPWKRLCPRRSFLRTTQNPPRALHIRRNHSAMATLYIKATPTDVETPLRRHQVDEERLADRPTTTAPRLETHMRDHLMVVTVAAVTMTEAAATGMEAAVHREEVHQVTPPTTPHLTHPTMTAEKARRTTTTTR